MLHKPRSAQGLRKRRNGNYLAFPKLDLLGALPTTEEYMLCIERRPCNGLPFNLEQVQVVVGRV